MRWLIPIVCFAITGCNPGPSLVAVTGKVLIDGQPLTHGKVQVAPATSRPAFATIQPDGTFRLTTFKDDDGLIAGTHPVAVIAHETLGPASQKWHAPKKYMRPETSGLSITVDRNTKEVLLELTWKGSESDKPYVEGVAKE